ncbi:hypothetical protein K504DRAFT_259654 [Pleomassaria siparia CBS 279.74]|uniref:Uncharacterized protein n=1 Tax=Pleomassaria siparia CBS 279.74 TaxID=1314801 RepID=A0A6G1KCI1_9PLEO|nr:hypothetical protein K504DRAFT_259654 [Pleomassaria siparia CBS 279.74]
MLVGSGLLPVEPPAGILRCCQFMLVGSGLLPVEPLAMIPALSNTLHAGGVRASACRAPSRAEARVHPSPSSAHQARIYPRESFPYFLLVGSGFRPVEPRAGRTTMPANQFIKHDIIERSRRRKIGLLSPAISCSIGHGITSTPSKNDNSKRHNVKKASKEATSGKGLVTDLSLRVSRQGLFWMVWDTLQAAYFSSTGLQEMAVMDKEKRGSLIYLSARGVLGYRRTRTYCGIVINSGVTVAL